MYSLCYEYSYAGRAYKRREEITSPPRVYYLYAIYNMIVLYDMGSIYYSISNTYNQW